MWGNEPGAVGWEARTLPLCYAAPLSHNICSMIGYKDTSGLMRPTLGTVHKKTTTAAFFLSDIEILSFMGKKFVKFIQNEFSQPSDFFSLWNNIWPMLVQMELSSITFSFFFVRLRYFEIPILQKSIFYFLPLKIFQPVSRGRRHLCGIHNFFRQWLLD